MICSAVRPGEGQTAGPSPRRDRGGASRPAPASGGGARSSEAVTAVGHRIVCFGDSNTYGYDPRSYLGGRYPASVRWTALLGEAGWDLINEGENGRCIPRRRRDIDALVQAVRRAEAGTVVVMLGSNDLLQMPCPSAKECAGRMERFLTILLHADGWEKSRKLLLIAPPPMALGTWVQDEETIATSHRLAECYENIARRLGIGFADAGGWCVGLTFDGVHFSEAGHLAFAEGVHQVLLALVSEKRGR